MEQRMIKFLSILFMGLLISSCYYDVEEELYPTGECVTDNVTYKNDISKIVNNSCLTGCHSSAVKIAGIDLATYEGVKKYVDLGNFLGSIKHESGFSAMPKGRSKIDACSISKIEKWINSGAQNN
jgi:hypothetical protein